ncbi:hypothetical protein Bbelb_370880 [Branchiostoma belcheri]|nr:hypothetical protein Bbelb_370880 [Branchiostoma belcheri]
MKVGERFKKDRLVAGDRQVDADRCHRRDTFTATNSSSRLRIVSCRPVFRVPSSGSRLQSARHRLPSAVGRGMHNAAGNHGASIYGPAGVDVAGPREALEMV